MCLVASSSPPLSPPPPGGDEKEEDSAEEEEADGGGGAPRDLGSAGTGRGGPGTAPLEPRVVGNSPRRTRSADRCAPSSGPAPGPAPRTCPYLSVGSASLSSHRGPAERKRNFPPPPSGAGGAPRAHPGERGGDPLRRRDFPGILVFLAWISERIKNGRECGGTGAAFSQAA